MFWLRQVVRYGGPMTSRVSFITCTIYKWNRFSSLHSLVLEELASFLTRPHTAAHWCSHQQNFSFFHSIYSPSLVRHLFCPFRISNAFTALSPPFIPVPKSKFNLGCHRTPLDDDKVKASHGKGEERSFPKVHYQISNSKIV